MFIICIAFTLGTTSTTTTTTTTVTVITSTTGKTRPHNDLCMYIL